MVGNIFLLERNIIISSEHLQLISFSFHYNSLYSLETLQDESNI